MPSPPPTQLLSDSESLQEYLTRHLVLLREREAQSGSWGDGLSSKEADELMEKLTPVFEGPDQVAPAAVWAAFEAVVKAETSWLFEERDPIGVAIAWALRRLEDILGNALETQGIVPRGELEKFVGLAVFAQSAQRQVQLKGDGPNWGIAVARLLDRFRGLNKKA